MALRRILFSRTESEREAMVLGGLFVGRVRGITANVLTLRLTNSILARDQLNPYLRSTQGLCRCFDPES